MVIWEALNEDTSYVTTFQKITSEPSGDSSYNYQYKESGATCGYMTY